MGRLYRPHVTCIPLHVKKAQCAEHLHMACALVTFIVVRTTKLASRRLWAIDATPPGTAHPAMGADALRRHHHSSQARAVVHQPPLGRHQARRRGPAAVRGAGRRRADTRGRAAGGTRGATRAVEKAVCISYTPAFPIRPAARARRAKTGAAKVRRVLATTALPARSTAATLERASASPGQAPDAVWLLLVLLRYHLAAAPMLSQRRQVTVPAIRDNLRAMAETVFSKIIRDELPCCAIGIVNLFMQMSSPGVEV